MAGSSGRGKLTSPLQPSATDVIVREGFICPICMQDKGTIIELQEHFELDHAEEDKTLLQQLKGLLLKKVGKSESPVLRRRHNNGGGFHSSDDESSFEQPVVWDPQALGQFGRHTDYFRKVRDSRMERFLVETNKLIIRLHKLVHEAPSDLRQRAVFEKHLASWVPDHDMPVCPGCGKSFKMFMRKHHCRLCGCVICNECSRFLSEDFVEKLTNPLGEPLRRGSDLKNGLTIDNGVSELKRSNSNESLMSIISSSIRSKDKEQLIRVCGICYDLLEQRVRQMDEKYVKCELEDLHERIAFAIADAEKIYPGYQEMAVSLHAGETNYQLQQAAQVRASLMHYFDTIDATSKKIAALPDPQNPKEEKLRANVRFNAVEFLKARVLTMPTLPNAEQCEELQRNRREDMKRRLEMQKSAAETRKREPPRSSSRDVTHKEVPKPKVKPVQSSNPFEDEGESDDAYNPFNDPDEESDSPNKSNGGWAPEPVRPEDLDADDDPLLQQIEIVKMTIAQAKRAGRTDEVASLTRNLDDLNQFYREKVVQQL